MEPIPLLGIAVCITGLVTLSSAQQWAITTLAPGPCVLPTVPKNGNYTSPLCQYTYHPACKGPLSFPVPDFWVLTFTCNEGYSLENQQDCVLVYCVNGKWYPKFPKCQKACGKKEPCPLTTEYPWHVGVYRAMNGGELSCLGTLISSHIVLTGLVTLSSAQDTTTTQPPGTCNLPTVPKNGNYISPSCRYRFHPSCQGQSGSPVPAYWVLSFTCNEGYSLDNEQDSFLVDCINGEWHPNIPKCQKSCGKKHSCPSTTEYPWHVGLYRRKDYSVGWELSCLGTLISSHIVLTAAGCVYSDNPQHAIHPSQVKVAIGKRYVKWSHDEPDSVKADVREISVPPQYVGKRTNYAHNIALLNLENSVKISPIIMPACFDWDRELTISPGARGTVTGWSGTSSLVNDTRLTYLDYRQCVFDVPAGDAGLVLPEKLCAEHRDGPPLTNVYQGAGITFVNNGAHYVFGVTSSIIKENRDITVGVFTNVTNSQLWDWITETKEKFDASHL